MAFQESSNLAKADCTPHIVSMTHAMTPATHTKIAHLAKRYQAASGLGMQVLSMIGGRAENLLERLPDNVKDRLEAGTERALLAALRTANSSRSVVGDQAGWLNTVATTAMGAAGGFGGLPSALAELPVTTTVLLRAILGVAAEHGFDPDSASVQATAIDVFATAGPLEVDDGSDLGFLMARATVTGPALNKIITAVAPKFAAVMGQKLAAQTVPVLGAVAGAATNYAFTSYYQEMAHVRFGLLRLSETSGTPIAELTQALRDEMNPKIRA